ncbi:fibroblast growth factor 23-like [Pseudonaja textilis]|uniref:fibroblast growth factor 23-like n=1 Tax=Pseudonaja textilis TaxID=8673 RepID=UPI000EAA5474|nr:fibroblast growth factor 23-like [Pseudonaja textilis]
MGPILDPVLLRVLKLLLPLGACGWGLAVAFPNWSNSDDVVHLYTSSQKKGLHLQIHPDGRVDGSSSQTAESALIIKAVSAGLVCIIGAKSRLNLCMDSKGNLFGSSSFREEDCVFKHTLLKNAFDVYESPTHRFLVSLGRVKKPLLPNRNLPYFSQFLTRRNEIPLSELSATRPREEETFDGYFEPCVPTSFGEVLTDLNDKCEL